MTIAAGALALAASLLAATLLHAQAPVAIGERVRFRAPGFAKGRQHGTVVQGGAGALTIQLENGGAPVEVPLDAFEHLEVARGKRRHFWTGAGIGFVPGFALGFYAGWGISCDEQGVPCSAGPALAAGGVLGAGTALAGGLVGLLFESDRWERLSAGRVRVSLAPTPRGGVVLRASFAF